MAQRTTKALSAAGAAFVAAVSAWGYYDEADVSPPGSDGVDGGVLTDVPTDPAGRVFADVPPMDGLLDDKHRSTPGTPCSVGRELPANPCHVTGTWARVPGVSWQMFCTAVGGEAVTEIPRNGIDDDCDGEVDELAKAVRLEIPR